MDHQIKAQYRIRSVGAGSFEAAQICALATAVGDSMIAIYCNLALICCFHNVIVVLYTVASAI